MENLTIAWILLTPIVPLILIKTFFPSKGKSIEEAFATLAVFVIIILGWWGIYFLIK